MSNSKKKYYSVTLVFFVLAIEIVSFFGVTLNILTIGETPKAYSKIFSEINSPETHWYTEKEPWGAWHKKNSKATLKTHCVNFKLSSNSVGARDSDFNLGAKDESQIVLLGDSFAEGYGVEIGQTAQRQIEELTKVNVLNFGASGGLGPLQYYLLYKNLAVKYPHNGLILFFLPSNDFTDNDYKYWEKNTERFIYNSTYERYRPYYLKTGANEFKFFYPENSVKREDWYDNSKTTNKGLIKFYKDYFWSANIFREINNLRNLYLNKAKIGHSNSYSGYYDANEEQQRAAIYFIKKIIDISPAKNIYIVSIPHISDFERKASLGKNDNRKEMIWWRSLDEFRLISDKNIVFTDLIDFGLKNNEKLFFKCDGHWNKFGNEWAAQIVSDVILNSGYR
jgi:hypothetical protein